MSNRRIHDLAVDVRAMRVRGCLFIYFFFTVLNKLRNYIQANGDQNSSFITTLVWRTWFVCVAKMGVLTLSLEWADSPTGSWIALEMLRLEPT